ncbi:MAG TPA: ATP-binding protein [Candidatus Binatia bacterium]
MSLKLSALFDRLRGPLPLRSHLIGLVLAAIAPLFLFAVFMIYRSAQDERAVFQRGAIERTRAIMTAVDAELKASITTLEALATARELDGDDLRDFYDQAMRVFKSQHDWSTINVADASGQQLMNLLRPFGSDLPKVAEPDKIATAFKTQTTAIGNLVLGTTTRQLDFAIRVPVVRNGRTKYVLSGVVKPAVIGALLAKQQIPAGWVLAVLDPNSRIVARTREAERSLGQFAAPDLRTALAESSEGWRRGRSLEGEEVYRAHTRSPFSGWSVSLNIPAAAVDAPFHGPVLYVTLFGIGLLALGIGIALLLSAKTAQSIEALSGLAGDLGLGRTAAAVAANAVPSRISEVENLREAFLTANRLIQERSEERDRFEQELWQQAGLLELAHDAIFAREFPGGPIIYWNRGAEILYGFSKTEALGQSPYTLLKTFHPRGMDFVEATLEREGEWYGELIHTTRDGRKIFSDSRHVLAGESQGRRVVLETNRDITERKREESRRRLQNAVNGILAESPGLREATPKVLQVLCELGDWDVGGIWEVDRAANELVCVEVWHLSSIEVSEFEADTRPRRFAPGVGLVGRVWKSGEPVWLPDATRDGNFPRASAARKDGIHAGFSFPIKLGAEVLGVIECFSREIRAPDADFLQTLATIGGQLGQFIQRKRAEEGLELLSRLPAENPEPVMRLREGHVLSFANPAAERLLAAWGTPLGEEAPAELSRAARAALADGRKGIFEIAFDNLAYAVTVAPVLEANYVNLYFSDITERKRAANTLKGFNEELEKRVAERTAEVTQVNAELVRSLAEREKLEEQLRHAQKMEAIGTLAGGVAHDFNNILGIILGHARELLSEGEKSRALEAILNAGERGAKIVKQLLAFARKPSVEDKPVDLNNLVDETADILKAVFPKTIALTLDLDAALPAIRGDQNQLQQVLINLCLNARDAMPDGGMLSIRSSRAVDPNFQAHAADAGGDYVRLEISDTGAGMDESTRRRIFEPFFTTKQASGGSGLGLSVVFGIVQAHGGLIDVESEAGRGTTFRLYFPAPSQPVAALELKEESPKRVVGSGETILVVDDEPYLLELIKSSAEKRGFQMLTAGDGLEALQVYRMHLGEIDVVVLDWGLPGLGGAAVFRGLKELNPQVNVVGVTGYLDPEVKSAMLQEGVRGFLQKPCGPDDILEKVLFFCRPADQR